MSTPLRVTALVAGLLALAWPAAAMAQRAGCAAGDAEHALQEAATRDYDEGRFAEAARKFEEVHRRSGNPDLLFNQAQAHRLAGACAPALAAYSSFLAAVAPGHPWRERAVRRQREMRDCLGPRAPGQGAPADPVQPGLHLAAPGTAPVLATRSRPWRRALGFGLLGLAAAAGVGAGVSGARAWQAREQLARPSARFGPAWEQRRKDLHDARALATVFAAGAVLTAAGGTALLLLAPAPGGPRGAGSAVAMTITCAGRF